MLASFMNYFGGRKDPKAAARDSIVQLRQQLILLEKKEDHLQKKIDEEHKVAKSNAVSNKSGEYGVPVTSFPPLELNKTIMNNNMLLLLTFFGSSRYYGT